MHLTSKACLVAGCRPIMPSAISLEYARILSLAPSVIAGLVVITQIDSQKSSHRVV